MSNNANHLAVVRVEGSPSQNVEPETRESSHEEGCIEEILNLHDEIDQQAKTILPKIMRIGELLVEQKQKLPHGQFARWIEKNLPFSTRTAQNYMRVFRHKEKIENENISVLSNAYNTMKLQRKRHKKTPGYGNNRRFITFSFYDEEKEIVETAKREIETGFSTIGIFQNCI